MPLTLHHLGISQSERIIWLLEELALPYTLTIHKRAPVLSPDTLKSVPGNATGKAPFLVDSDTGVTLSESAAICEYIINVYGDGRLSVQPDGAGGAKGYADYVYWFHYANGTLQAELVNNMFLGGTSPSDAPIVQFARQRMDAAWQRLDERLGQTGKWLAGDEFTAADIMTVYCATTQRYFGPLDDLSGYKNLMRWVKECTARPAYKKAMEKGDPEMKVLDGASPPGVSMMEVNGTESGHWKK